MEHLAVRGARLASAAHEEVAIWQQASNGNSHSYHQGSVAHQLEGQWKHVLDLPAPPTNSANEDSHVLVSSVHWTRTKNYASLLLVTYMFHGYM